MQTEQFRLNAAIELEHWWFTARRAILRDLVDRVLPPDGRPLVIDIGCGTGGNIAAFADAYSCVAIDPSSEAIDWARQRFPAVDFRCGVAPGDLGSLMHDAALLMLNDVLEHVPDDFALLSEVTATMSPGGLLLLSVPADMRLWSMHDVSHGHYRRYDLARFRRLWRDLPLEPRLVSYFNTRLYPLVRGVRWFNRCLRRAAGDAGTDLRVPAPWLNRQLARIFAGERRRLSRALATGTTGYRYGVSCVAILERRAGQAVVAGRPADVPADIHGPEIDRAVGAQVVAP